MECGIGKGRFCFPREKILLCDFPSRQSLDMGIEGGNRSWSSYAILEGLLGIQEFVGFGKEFCFLMEITELLKEGE